MILPLSPKPLAGVLLCAAAWFAAPGDAGATPASRDETPELAPVQKGPFVVAHEFAGSFDQPDAPPVRCLPQAYKGPLKVLEAAAPGPVLADQLLVKFDLTEVDQQIEKARLDLEIARAGLEKRHAEARHAEEAAALALEMAEKAHEKARQTLETYRDVLMPMRRAEAELSLQSSRDRLQDEEDQFEQLLKMYESDDLVEETEEIVLARARRGLEQQRKRMNFTERRHELEMKFEVPRELEGHEFALRKARNELERLNATAALSREQARMEREKAAAALRRQEEDLRTLEADRGRLRLVAPREGLAVRGQLERGKWSKLASEPDGLEADSLVTAGQVLYTVVQSGPRTVRTSAPEAAMLDLREGQAATVIPAALPGLRLAATVRRVAPVSGDGSYDVWLELEAPDTRLLPGHTCQVKVTVEELEDVLTVPQTAVDHTAAGARVFVWQDDEARPRAVELGRAHEGRVHVRSGLTEGDQVLRKASEGAK